MYFDAIDLNSLKEKAWMELNELEVWINTTFKPVEDASTIFDEDLTKWETFSSAKWENMSKAD